MEHFASELLKEIKSQSKRWFICFMVALVLWFTTIGIFIWYISLPVEDVSIENETGNATYVGHDFNGGVYDGTNPSCETESGEVGK